MPAVNAQMKQFFKKEWINVTMYAVITLLLFCSMFWEPLVYVTFIAMVLFCAFRPVQQTFYLIFFSYPFLNILNISINNEYISLYSAFCLISLFILGIKYLIDVFQKRKTFNLYLFILSMACLLYSFLPFFSFKILTMLLMVRIIAGLYLCYEYREKICFKNLILIASIGLIISCLFSFVAFETPRMLSLLTQYANYGYIKFQGIFENPNSLSTFSIIILSFLLVNYFKEHQWYDLLLFFIIYTFTYMSISRNFIVCIAIMLIIYFIFEIIYYKKKSVTRFAIIATTIIVLSGVMITSTKLYLIRFNILPESSIVQQEKINAAVVFPSIPAEPNMPDSISDSSTDIDDPGREGLWQRYWADYVSSWKVILFGRGMSYQLGQLGTHQGYLNILWQCGIVGTLLFLTLIMRYFNDLFRKKTDLYLLIALIPFLVINFVESLLFNYWTLLFCIPMILLNNKVGFDEKT